jgi:hypothetical protein
MSMKKVLLLIISGIILFSCSKKEERKLLYSCMGTFYAKMTDDSFKPLAPNNIIPMNPTLFVGDKEVEMGGITYEICDNKKTYIKFGNCENKDNVNYHMFDFGTQKLFGYSFFSETYREKKKFPLHGEDLRGEYFCKPVETKNSK